jgi:biotin carboxyl carrier protein
VHYEIEVEGRIKHVAVYRVGDNFDVQIDGRSWYIDAVRVDSHTLSLIVGTSPDGDTDDTTAAPERHRKAELSRSGGRSHEVTIASDAAGQSVAHVGTMPFVVALNRRRRTREDGHGAGEGPRQIAAPMPGKVVRILVASGDIVHARQPLMVVEAMKMENELRAGRDGTVGDIHVKEGASVEAGALLVDIR